MLSHHLRIAFLLTGVIGVSIFIVPSQTNLWLLLIAATLTLLYSVPLLPIHLPVFISNRGFIKTLLLAFTWTFVTAYLPMNEAGIAIELPVYILLLIQRFLFMLILCLLFDSRDVLADAKIGLHSFATDVKPVVLKYSILGLFALLTIVIMLLYSNGLLLVQAAALLLTALICLIVYFISFKKRGYIFYYFGVDGLMILSALLTALASIIH